MLYGIHTSSQIVLESFNLIILKIIDGYIKDKKSIRFQKRLYKDSNFSLSRIIKYKLLTHKYLEGKIFWVWVICLIRFNWRIGIRILFPYWHSISAQCRTIIITTIYNISQLRLLLRNVDLRLQETSLWYR